MCKFFQLLFITLFTLNSSILIALSEDYDFNINLINLLKNTNEAKRLEAALLLGNMSSGAIDAVPNLIAALEVEKNIKVKIEIIRALERIAGMANLTVPALIKELKSNHSEVRWAAAGSLVTFGKKAELAVPALILLLEDEHKNVQASAAGTLSKMGILSATSLISIILDKENSLNLRKNAIKAVGGLGVSAHTVVPNLIDFSYEEQNITLKIESIRALRNIISDESSPGEIGWLNDPKTRVWPKAAVQPMQNKEKLDLHLKLLKQIVDLFIYHSNDQNVEVRYQSIKGLSQFGKLSEETFPILLKMLNDREPKIRRVSVQAIGTMDFRSDEVIPELVGALSDNSHEVIWAAMNALTKYGSEALPEIREALAYDDPELTPIILQIIFQLGPLAKNTIPLVVRLLHAEETDTRMLAAEALGGIGVLTIEINEMLVLAASNDEDIKVRKAAEWALNRIGKKSSRGLNENNQL